MNEQAKSILAMAPVVPVITLNSVEDAVPLAKALIAGGIPVLEVTLRTPSGLAGIERITGEVERAIVGAGTVLNKTDLERALAAGSQFIVTPGVTDELLQAGVDCGVPFLPGVATVSEIMRCLDQGIRVLKFFPAEAMGGAKVLKAFGGPFPDVCFCPTGGIGLNNMADYLKLPSVLSVGGSWIVPEKLMAEKNWAGITALTKEACERVKELKD